MKRIIIHWTAGAYGVTDFEREHYHFLIDRDGQVVEGKHRPEANLNVGSGVYAAHTRGLNTGSIGVAVDAMRNARERPFSEGDQPITPEQLDGLAELCADLCDLYEIPVGRTTVLTHAEVEPTLGVKQKGKWDITWLPGMASTGDPIVVGDRLRAMIRAKLPDRRSVRPETPPVGAKAGHPRESVAATTTARAAVVQGAGAVAAGVAAVKELDGTVQMIAVAGAFLLAITALIVFRERVKHWRAGVR